MDLEKVLKKYDFVNATEETSDEFRDLLNENQSNFEEAGNLKSLQRCLSVLQEKLCIKGYPVDGTPSHDMAFTSIEIIGDVMDECVDNDRASEKDCQKMLFEFLLACICVGSGSTVMEMIPKVLGIQDLKNYIREMKETELAKIFSALKKVTHTSEEPKVSIVDQASAWDDCVSGVILDLLSENTNIETAECQDQLLDLYMFYYLRMTDMPVEYALSLHRVMSNIKDFYREKYDCNPFKAIKNTDGIRKHMVTVQGVVCNEKFGRSEKQLDMTQKIVELILYSISSSEKLKDLESIWGSVLDFMKTMAFSKKCAEHPQVLEPFGRHLFDELPEDYVTDHPQLIDEWAPVFGEILLKAPSVNALHTWAYRMADTAQGLAVVKKESAVIWFPLVKGLLRCGHQQSLKVAERILEGVKFKKIWTWKKNYNHAMEMIETISKVDFPTSGKDSDVKLLRAYGDIIKCLLEQLSLVKVAEKAMGVVSVFVINLMEKQSETLNEFTEGFASSISLQNNLEVIPDLIKKFSALIMDEDYPWDHSDTQRCGESILINIIDAYSSGMDMPDDVVKTMVNMFLYAMETDDLDYMNVVTGFVSMHGCVASTFLRRFVDKHLGTENADRVLVPLMPVIMKQLNHEEDSLKEASRTILSLASNQAPAAISPYLPAVIKWYAATRDIKALSALWMPYKKSDGISQEDFNELMKTMKSDTQADSGSMQSVILMDIGEKQPELFTKESVDMMLSERFIDSTNDQYRILCALTFVVPKKSEMFGINIVDRVLRNKKLNLTYTSALQSIGVSLASQHPELVDTVLAELVNLSKKCDNPVFQVALIDGIHTVGTQQGPERLKPHRPYIEDLQKDGATAGIKEMATSILNAMDGISVEGIVEDVKQQKGDINVLNTKVTENTEKVNVVDKKVDNQGKEIATVKTGLIATDKRVDNVEKDLDETKIKVEEVDNKTMTNAPKWSRDLTKLMNPTTEHDWRLLAQRLGYTPQDIKGWVTQHDPCMGLLSEWYATHKTIEATHAVLTALQEMNRMDAAAIVENAMKAVEGVVEEEVDYVTPPPIFLSYQWGHQNEVKLLRNHLQMAGYECWMDIGQMGGGDKLFEKIDNGIRGAKIIICCVSEKYSKSPNCNREVNLSTNLGKPMIPLLMEKMSWPPKGSMGPIFSEYLFVRFFQRGGEETKDQRYWPVPKFQELLMQLNMYQALPDESLITKEYKNWWKPVAEEIVITKKKGGDKGQSSSGKEISLKEEEDSPDVFLSYQWGKQNQIKQLYRRLNELGYSCWMDIYQMGGGDSLYDKIDRGVRGCKVVLSCVTTKYALSANCRREVSLADSLKKPMVPLLLEKMDWPPTGPMSMVFTQLLFINFYRDEKVQMSWDGSKFDELHGKINECLSLSAGDQPAIKGPEKGPKEETNKNQAQVSSKEVTKPVQQAQEEQVTPKEETKTVVKPNKKSSSCILL